jgi:hypothetical protein
MKTNTDSRFSSAVGGPTKPATTSTGSSATPIAPHRNSTARLPSSEPRPQGSGRQRVSPSSRDSGHSAASAANDTTSTSAAAQPNSHSGIGRF